MKKILLLFIAVIVCSTLMAQHKMSSTKLQSATSTNYYVGSEQEDVFTPTFTPTILQKKVTAVGETYYNLPTNAFARNTINFRPNTNDAAVVWTMALDNDSRGTGINYYTNGEWDPMPAADARIETVRNGWGIHGFTNEGEIVVAHNGLVNLEGGLTVNTRDKWGEGEWNEYTLNGPEYTMPPGTTATTGILWPTMVTNGDVVHLVCVTDQWGDPGAGKRHGEYIHGYKPDGTTTYSTVPLYYRSKDGGKTWDIKAHDFLNEGMTPYEVHQTSGDNYSLTVKGDHIVLLYAPNGGICYMESKDGGDTWTKKMIYDPEEFTYYTSENNLRLAPVSGTAYIDESGKVHVAFSSVPARSEGLVNYSYYYAIPVGLIYWNESFPKITKEDVKGWLDDPYVYWEWESCRGYMQLPSVLGFDRFLEDEENDPPLVATQFRGSLWATFPRIITKGEKVFLSYQAPLEYPLIYGSDPNNFYHGAFVTTSLDKGETWNVVENTSWISYTPNVFMCEWDQYSGPLSKIEGSDTIPYWEGMIVIKAQSDNAYPTMSTNIASNGNFFFQWYSQYTPFVEAGGIVSDPIEVYTLIKNLDVFPDYANIRDIYKGKFDPNLAVIENPTINLKIYPNPATEGIVNIKVDTNRPYTITVTNIMGQVVHNMTGNSNKTELNISNFIPGIYLVTVKTNKTIATQKLIVK
jgi:hypothetical protein